MKKWAVSFLILIVLSVVLSSAVFAARFTVETTAVKDVIDVDGVAVFKLIITNNGVDDEFRVYYNGVEWDIQPVSFDLKSGAKEELTMNVRPLYVSAGQYAVTVTVKTNEGNEVKPVPLMINVKDKTMSSYLPSVGVMVDMPSVITPNEDLKISMEIKNKNPLELSKLSVNIDSDFFSGTKEIALGPTTTNNVSSQNIEFSFPIKESIAPQDIPVTFTIISNNQTVYIHQKNLEIKEYSPDFVIEKNMDKSFFKTTETFKITNTGNINKKEIYKVKIPLFRDLFASEEPKAGVLKEDGNRYFFWELELKPGEVTSISVVVNYRPFLLFLLIIAIAVILYFTLRSQLTITKSAQVIRKEEGGISMLKVMIRIKNISEKAISDVSIFDTIPNLADYVREDAMGSMSPSKVIKHEGKGTLLKWEVPSIEGFEERIITYKIRAQLKILGGLNLPAASGRFKSINGKSRFSKSNMFKLVMKTPERIQ